VGCGGCDRSGLDNSHWIGFNRNVLPPWCCSILWGGPTLVLGPSNYSCLHVCANFFFRFDRSTPNYGCYFITSRFSYQRSSLSSAIPYYSSSFEAICIFTAEGSPSATDGRDKWEVTMIIGTCFPSLLTGCSGEQSVLVYDHQLTRIQRYPISMFRFV
jgi:hypothetical protein